MATLEHHLDNFFQNYEARIEKALQENPEVDVKATADAFADFFVEASPAGISGGKNDEDFQKQIPKGFEFYRSIGTKSMKVVSKQITQLDAFHTLVKAHWKALYEKTDGTNDEIEFDVIYFVQTLGEKSKIFAYITGDEQKIMKEHGLIPSE